MGFIKTSKASINPKERLLATQLRSIIQSKTSRLRVCNISKWSQDFKALLRHHSYEDISKTLEWYEMHINKEYIPQAFSARSFCKKYDQILEAKDRTLPNVIPTEASILLQRKLGLFWPNKEKDVELAFIELSMTSYSAWLNKLKGKVESSADNRLAKYLWETREPPNHFVECWLQDIHRLAWTWGLWKGDLLRFVFHPESRHFQKMMEEKTMLFCYDVQRWRKLYEEITGSLSLVRREE